MDILTRYRETLITKLDELLGGPPSPVLDMCRYHMGLAEADGKPRSDGLGKMVRPALCLAMFEALEIEDPWKKASPDTWEGCVPAALAIELVHRTSLVFDDMQDHSPQRNHRASLWTAWGTEQALNGGLTLSSFARLALQDMGAGYLFWEIHRLLELTVIDLCRGQYMDLEFQQRAPTLEEYLEMVRLKTGVLMGTACEVGALVASAEGKRGLARRFGETMGVAFQLQDDCLGVWGEPETMGKLPSDLEEGKRGLPVVLALGTYPYVAPTLLENDPKALLDLLRSTDMVAKVNHQVRRAGSAVLGSLAKLELDKKWEGTFRELARFAVARVS